MTSTLAAPSAVFDARVVTNLTGDSGDLAFAHDFVSRFRRLLPERVSRIRGSLRAEEVKEALDAVRSLKVSACMLGAQELCGVCIRIEEQLRRSDLVGCRVVAEELIGAELRVDRALDAFLHG